MFLTLLDTVSENLYSSTILLDSFIVQLSRKQEQCKLYHLVSDMVLNIRSISQFQYQFSFSPLSIN
jgi:hypothetical protein